jgi:glycine/sarcosine N-methyltransferase
MHLTIRSIMSLYNIIADIYDTLFPVQVNKVHFVQSYFESRPLRILDIGCATGELASKLCLANQNIELIGLDLNVKMIELAKHRYSHVPNLQFLAQDMLDILHLEPFDIILCLGNTLPHLPNNQAVELFLNTLYGKLNAKGKLILQFLNYDKILQTKQAHFTPVESDHYIFKRTYLDIQVKQIQFQIQLFTKATHEVYSDSVTLTPIFHNALKQTLATIGYEAVESLRNWKKEASTNDEDSRIMVATK